MYPRIVAFLTLVGAVLPEPSLAVTLASGSATSRFTLTFSNFDPANEFGYPYCLGGVFLNRASGPNTTGQGLASGSAEIPDPTCTVLPDGWRVTAPQRTVEGSAGLEFPLELPLHDDHGSFGTQLYAEFDAEGLTVDDERTVSVTVQGLLSASGQTEALEVSPGPHQSASTASEMSSRGRLRTASDGDPQFPSDFLNLWDFDFRCRDFVKQGATADCSFDEQRALDQSYAFQLRPGYRYWFDLSITESFTVLAASSRIPEPATFALFALGLIGVRIGSTRHRPGGR